MSIAKTLAKFTRSLNSDASHKGGHEPGDIKWSARATPSAGWLLCDGSAVSRTTQAALFAAIGTTYGAGDGTNTFNLPDFRGRSPVGAGTGSFSEAFAASAVTVAADTFTTAANAEKWLTGTPVVLTTSGTAPTGLTAGSTYYVIRISNVAIKLASTLANAVAGTGIDITGQGTGTHTLTASLTARSRGDFFGEEKHALVTAEIPAHSHPINSNSNRNTVSGGSDNVAMGGASTINTQAVGGSGAHNIMQPSLVANVFIYAGA